MNLMAVLRRCPLSAISVALLAATAAAARFAVPYSIEAFSSAVPRLWSSVRFWLVPPYLFITVHLIIVVIWKLSDQTLHKSPNSTDKQPSEALKPRDSSLDVDVTPSVAAAAEGNGESANISPISAARSAESCVTTDSDENSAVSSRIDFEKCEEEDEEAMDLVDTWQAIMKKSATWERSSETAVVAAEAAGGRAVKSSVTFAESSPAFDGNDEMNRRFEAFIKKNYDQIRSY